MNSEVALGERQLALSVKLRKVIRLEPANDERLTLKSILDMVRCGSYISLPFVRTLRAFIGSTLDAPASQFHYNFAKAHALFLLIIPLLHR